MKVLWLTEFFPDKKEKNTTGGVEARYFFLARFFEKTSITVQVVHRQNIKGDTTLNFFDFIRRIGFFFTTIFSGLTSDFDLVEGTNLTTYFPAWIVGKVKNRPVLFCIHDVFGNDWFTNFGLLGMVGLIAEKISLSLPGVVYLSVSETVKQKLIVAGKTASNIHLSPNGTDVLKALPKRAKKNDIVFVGRLVKYKNVSHIIQLTADLKKIFPKITALIIGTGPEKQVLEELSRDLGLTKNVAFAGFVSSHNDVLEKMRQSRVFCTASMVEGFGMALVEAAGQGLPYVAYDIPVVSEVTKNGQGGFLIKPNDFPEFVSATTKLLADKELCRKMATSALDLAQGYNWEKVGQQLKRIYETVA